MIQFDTEADFLRWVDDCLKMAEPMRRELARQVGIDMCYYEGAQWIATGTPLPKGYAAVSRLFADWNPDSTKLRVTINRTTRFLVGMATATMPQALNPVVFPAAYDYQTDAMVAADVRERLLTAAVRDSAFTETARDSQFRRCVCGCYGMGIRLNQFTMPDGSVGQRCEAFSFDPYRLVLDPYVMHRDLSRHEYVGYQDVWTYSKVMRVLGAALKDLGITIDPDKLQTVGALMPLHLEMNTLSQNRLYTQYRAHSRTPAMRVSEWYIKGADGKRFDRRYVVIDDVPKPDGTTERMVLSFDNPVNPYGGNGLPLALLNGHRRGDTLPGISDVRMMRDDQDRINLLGSLMFRCLQKSAGFQVWVDKRAIPKGTPEEQFKYSFSNTVGGVVLWDAGSKQNPHSAPQLVQYPTIPPNVFQIHSEFQNEMREQTFRSDANYGATKSHVPDRTYQTSLEEADRVVSSRIVEDIEVYIKLQEVLLGTTIRAAHEMSYPTLRMLGDAGFTDEDFEYLANMDPDEIGAIITIPQDAVRVRSPKLRSEELDKALQFQAITPLQYRRAKAKLDLAIIDDDRRIEMFAAKAAMRIINGETWQPLPLGPEFSTIVLDEFRLALTDRRVQTDPEAMMRLAQAIQAQEMLLMPPVDAESGEGTMSASAPTGGDVQDFGSVLDEMVTPPAPEPMR